MPYDNRKCTDCGIEYQPYQYNQKRCGACVAGLGGKYKGTPPVQICTNCDKEFVRRTPRQKYCSKECGGTPRHAHILKAYGLTAKDYNDLMQKCGGRCTICKQKETASIRGKVAELTVDHCHTTGKVRGLLCRQCNVGLGNFKDKVDLLHAAIKYLEGSETIPKGSTPEANAGGSA